MTKNRRQWMILIVLGVTAALKAQAPHLINAQVQTRPVERSLEATVRALVAAQTTAAWIGYAVPMVAGDRHTCCDDFGCCRLEGGRGVSAYSGSDRAGRRVDLESPQRLLVLFRAENARVDKIRTFSEDCELDAGGLPFFWLTNVGAADSVALLAQFVRSSQPAGRQDGGEDGTHLTASALAAMAMHAGPEADAALDEFVDSKQPEGFREQASFWLGAARGQRGYETLRRVVNQDPSDHVREKAVFALSVSPVSQAVDAIIGVAHSDPSPQVRGQALFWLAQKAGKKAEQTITEAIERDPETEVKKRAVFALSQLPPDQGVPMLIQVARSNHNPAVRKQAMFWLGQSHDPRALEFFEQVLGTSRQ